MRIRGNWLALLLVCATSYADTTLKIFPALDSTHYLLSAIAAAHHTIQITAYGFTYKKIAQALIQKEKQGVRVQLLIEAQPYRARAENAYIVQRLRRARIEIRYTMPRFLLTHQKTVLIDGQRALIMTGNLTYSSFYTQRNFLLNTQEPSLIAELQRLFQADWSRSTAPFAPQAPLVTSPENSAATLLALIQGAHHRLDIYALAVTDQRILKALMQQRSVKIRILISATAPTVPTKKLCRRGIAVHQLRSLTQHAKVLYRDALDVNRLAYLGSANLTYASLSLNREAGILFSDAPALQQLHTYFEQDWKQSRTLC